VPSIFIGLLLAQFIPPLVYFNLAFARVLLLLYINYENEMQRYEILEKKKKNRLKRYLIRRAVAGSTRKRLPFIKGPVQFALFYVPRMKWVFFYFPLTSFDKRWIWHGQ
jgi:hypothetical protein